MTSRSSLWSNTPRALVWSLANVGLVACGAFDGGQSGTDSLEAIGVNKPLMKCEAGDEAHEAGEKIVQKNGCEECVCQENGTWNCLVVDDCAQGTVDEEGAGSDPRAPDAAVISLAPTSEPSTTVTSTNIQPDPDCIEPPSGPSIGGSSGMYIAADPAAHVCVTYASETELCMKGALVEAGEDYANWGGGIGLVMATETDGVVTPFDATARGITNVTFKLTGVDGVFLRAYLNQANDPNIIDESSDYHDNSFVLLETTGDGSVTLPIARAALPDWTLLDVDNDGQSDPETPIDPSKLNSLQFFVASQPDVGVDFDLCISDVQWVDENDQTIVPAN